MKGTILSKVIYLNPFAIQNNFQNSLCIYLNEGGGVKFQTTILKCPLVLFTVAQNNFPKKTTKTGYKFVFLKNLFRDLLGRFFTTLILHFHLQRYDPLIVFTI